jgi:hypothetical protein
VAGNRSVFIASKAERSGPWLGAASFDRRRMESRTSSSTRGTSSLWWGGFDVCPKLGDLHPPLPVSILESSCSDFDLSGHFLTTTDTLSGTSPTRSARRCPTEICHRATPSSRDSKLSRPACLQRWPTSIIGNAACQGASDRNQARSSSRKLQPNTRVPLVNFYQQNAQPASGGSSNRPLSPNCYTRGF